MTQLKNVAANHCVACKPVQSDIRLPSYTDLQQRVQAVEDGDRPASRDHGQHRQAAAQPLQRASTVRDAVPDRRGLAKRLVGVAPERLKNPGDTSIMQPFSQRTTWHWPRKACQT